MATFEQYGSINSSYKLQLNVNEDSYSIANNSSVVSWSLYLISTTYNFSTIGMTATVYIDGQEVLNEYAQRTLGKNSSLYLGSGTTTVYHNSDGKKSIGVSGSLTMNSTSSYVPGNTTASGTVDLTSIPRYATISAYVSRKTINSITINWSTDANVDQFQYKLGAGSWVDAEININKSSGSFTINGLNPNTSYLISFDAKRRDSQLWSTWGGKGTSLNSSTNQISIVSAPNFNIGDNESITFTNPNDGSVIQTGIYLPDAATVIAPYRTVNGTAYTFYFNDAELDRLYKLLGKSNTLTVRVYNSTSLNGRTYLDYAQRTCTLTGNQKTGHVNVNNIWKRTKKWLNLEGTWKRCVRWVNDNGTWKRCI